ncbi:MAG: metal-sensing transcriptional repressor [Oscillospiraceae bacterium]|nr:metal-sensing transcriptional repressor [Oscillospiraceae bacterium]
MEQAEKTWDGSEAEPCCAGTEETGCCATKLRSEEELRDLSHRLSRIEGQIRGIKGMLERDAYCIDILNQVSAASSALNSFTKVLLSSHIRSCVAEDIRDGREDKLEELVRTLQKLMR